MKIYWLDLTLSVQLSNTSPTWELGRGVGWEVICVNVLSVTRCLGCALGTDRPAHKNTQTARRRGLPSQVIGAATGHRADSSRRVTSTGAGCWGQAIVFVLRRNPLPKIYVPHRTPVLYETSDVNTISDLTLLVDGYTWKLKGYGVKRNITNVLYDNFWKKSTICKIPD